MMTAVAIGIASVNSVRCQEPIKPIIHPAHSTELDFWDSIRVLPVKVTYYELVNRIVDYTYEDGETIQAGQFQVTTTTTIRQDIRKGKEYMVAYCGAKHGTGLNERIKYLILIERAVVKD